MEVSQVINLFVTHVEKEGPFLKLWGQSEKGRSVHIEQILLGVSSQFDAGVGKIAAEVLQPGTLVCAKYKDNKYYRARILNNDFIRQDFVEVTFLDYGNKDVIPCANIRSLQNFPTSFISIPPLAIGFIFAEAHAPGGGEWNEANFQNISKEIRGREVQCHLLTQATNYYLVKIFIDGTDLCNVLIQRGLMQPISLQAQQAVMLSMSLQKQQQQQQQAVAPTLAAPQNMPTNMGLNTYKACTLEPGCLYPVYVSYINDGPCHFSVQLKQSEDVLVKLMNDINSLNLRMLEEVPIPGTICLSRCQEDGNICRAVVTNEVDNLFKVFYVDFGNYEVVPLDSLYQIPFKFVLPKVMAIRLSLAGVEKPTVTLEMQCAFKTFVDNRLLHMKVLPTATRMAIPKCELWDPDTKTSALDVVNRAARHAYPEPIALTRGFSQHVKISYVYSCNRFYVQLANKEDELLSLMQDLQEICITNEVMDPSSIKVGVPCCALYDEDGQWYRAQVVEVLGNTVKVRYIDFGNEEEVACTQLKEIDGEQLTVLRPQAIECSLNGYQNMDVDPERDSLLEELILEGNFTMKVVEMFDKKALVDLFDAGNYNVASLLVDRIAAAKSQVSPMLMVQAGNKLEHRKSTLSQNNAPRGDGQSFRKEGFRGDRGERQDNRGDRQDSRGDRQDNRGEQQDNRGDRQDHRGDRQDNRRERRDWNNKSNDRNEKSWRQDRQDAADFRNNDRNEATGSWRQNNNGFSVNERLNRNKPQGDAWKTAEAVSDTNDNWDNPGTTETPTGQKWNNTDTQTALNSGGGGDGWNDANQNQTSTQEGDGFRKKNFDRNKVGRFNDRGDRFSDRGDRFNDKGDRFSGKPKEGGFKKRDHNEHDSSGSEKSFQHKGGPRSSSRNDHAGFHKKFDKPYDKPRNTSHSANTDDSWNVSAVNMSIDAAPVTATYTLYEVIGSKASVSISWFHSPSHFYVQLVDFQDEFKSMMKEIQLFYKSRKPEQSVCGAPVIGLFPEDNVLYRAQVLEVIGSQYKVYYVDFGNVSIISKVWPIEKKFMNLPAQAVVCGLKGIRPSGDNWPDSDTCGHYFENESFICEFIDKDEVKTYVNLLSDQTSISDLLVQAGIAVTAQPTIPSIEIPLLLSQQFRAVIKSVNNLSDIIIALECGVAVSCAMHNLETATETFEDNLKRLLEQTVIVYVDNVIDDKLEVTLYDTEGTKLVILYPDEGAYDSVESVCPMLILNSIIRGYVSHTSETFVYIQPAEYSETITWLLDQMFEQFENLNQENAIIPDEEQVYAVHSEDGNWYRGRVLNFDDEKVTVNFIDYGNSEDVKFEALRELDPKFKEMSILCLQVNTGEDTSIFADKDVSATIYYGEEGWEGTVQTLESSTTESVTLAPTDDTGFATSSAETIEVVETENVDQIIEEESSEPAIPCIKGDTANLTIPREDGKILVRVSHVDSPNEFYIQLLSSVDAIKELQRILQEQVEGMPVLENPAAGILCTAPYSVDQQWYRAEILDADDDITTVRFVDIGNTDVINNKLTQIKTLPPNFLSLAVYATKCSLNIKPKNSEWDTVALGLFETLTAENSIAEFLNQDEKINYVELYTEGQKFSDIFIRENLAIPASETHTESKLTAFVSHLNSPSEFWIQLENCIDELEWIAEQLSAAETFPELEDLAPGTLCAALFPDDQMWYRARILSNTVAGIELLFIDYGNSCSSNSLRQLPEDLVITPPLALKCSLQKPEGIPNWTQEVAQKFSDISADGQTIFTVKKLTAGETTFVQLLLDGEDIIHNLQPDTEDGYISEVENLDALKIKIDEETRPETFELEKLPGMDWNEEARLKFEELNKQGNTLFQIEFVADRVIRLYLNGVDIRADLGGDKIPSLNVSQSEDDHLYLTETPASTESTKICEKTEHNLSGPEISGSLLELEESTISQTNESKLNTKECAKDVQNDIKEHSTLHLEVKSDEIIDGENLTNNDGLPKNNNQEQQKEEVNDQMISDHPIKLQFDKSQNIQLETDKLISDTKVINNDSLPEYDVENMQQSLQNPNVEFSNHNEEEQKKEIEDHIMSDHHVTPQLNEASQNIPIDTVLLHEEEQKEEINNCVISDHYITALIRDENLTCNNALPKDSEENLPLSLQKPNDELLSIHNEKEEKKYRIISDHTVTPQLDEASQNIRSEKILSINDKLIGGGNLTNTDVLPIDDIGSLQNSNSELSNCHEEKQTEEKNYPMISDQSVMSQLNEVVVSVDDKLIGDENLPNDEILPSDNVGNLQLPLQNPNAELSTNCNKGEQTEEINDPVISDYSDMPQLNEVVVAVDDKLIGDENLTNNEILPSDNVGNLQLLLQNSNAELSTNCNKEEQTEEINDTLISDHSDIPHLNEVVVSLDDKLIGDQDLTNNDGLPSDSVGNLQLPLQKSNAELSYHTAEEQTEEKNDPVISDHLDMPQLNEVVISLNDKLIGVQNLTNNDGLSSDSVGNLLLSSPNPNIELSTHEEQQKERINCQIILDHPITLQLDDASQNIQVETDRTSSLKIECNKVEDLTEVTKDVNDTVNKLLETEPPEILEESQHLADSGTCEQLTRLTEDNKTFSVKDTLTELKEIREIEQEYKENDQSETESVNKIEELQTLTETINTKESKVLDKSTKLLRKGKKMLEESESKLLKELEMITNKGKTPPASSNESSRSSSRGSLRHSRHDDRILPGYFSRPDTPITDEIHALKECSSQNKMSYDEKIVPAVLSRPHSPHSEPEGSSKSGEK